MLTRLGYVVHKKDLTPSQLLDIRGELTVQADWDKESGYGTAPPKFRVFLENENKLCLPSFYGLSLFGKPQDTLTPETRQSLRFRGALKEQLGQQVAVDAAKRAFADTGGGILSLPPGSGKTTITLYLACELKVKTLIVVHKQFLADQWLERINCFVPDAKVGRIQGATTDTDDKDIVIAMLQSLCQRQYPTETLAGFGFMCVDEAHCICAPTFSRALLRVNTPYKLAVSATPHRKDGLTKVIQWFIGPVFHSSTSKKRPHVTVEVLRHNCATYDDPPPINRQGRICMASMLNIITALPERDAQIIARLRSFVRSGRKVLVLTDRRHHCEVLMSGLSEHGVDVGLYMGGMKQTALQESALCDVIIGTYSLSKEGLDIPTLNTLVLASPKTDVIQAVGRIMREASDVGQCMPPMILDIVDMWACLPQQYQKRKAFYAESGFTVRDLKASPVLSRGQQSLCNFI